MPTDPPADRPPATIVIVTRNRRDRVRAAVASAVAQRGGAEVLVIDDGSTDGTSEAIRADFHSVRVVAHADRQGYIVRRSEAGQLARGDVLFSMDDDAVYADPDVVGDTLAALAADARVGAVMIPHVNCDADGHVKWPAPVAPDDGEPYVTGSFIGTGYAVRRALFNDLGGFRDCLFHWAEETDFCVRLMDAGRFVLIGPRHRIRHYPNWDGKYDRDTLERVYRNRILTVAFNAPTVLLIPLLAAQLAYAGRQALGRGARPVVVAGTRRGLIDMARLWRRERRPVRLSAYRLWLRLRAGRVARLSAVAPKLRS